MHESDGEVDCETLPIGYYPAMSDADLDKILVDESAYTVEWMITPAAHADSIDPGVMTLGNAFVRHSNGVSLSVGGSRQDHKGQPVELAEGVGFDAKNGLAIGGRETWGSTTGRYTVVGAAEEGA